MLDRQVAAKVSVRRIDRRRRLVPDLDLVALEIQRKKIRLAGRKFAASQDFSASAFNGCGGRVDVRGVGQAKPEMENSSSPPGVAAALFDHDDVTTARSLQLHESVAANHRDRSENLLVKSRRPIDIANRECQMGQSVS